jgi:hypothetical protein
VGFVKSLESFGSPGQFAIVKTDEFADGDVLRWTLIDDSIQHGPHAEVFRSERRGGLHLTEARRLLETAGHPDAEHVRVVG